ncbi:hypothetical protein [Cellulomonas shaoxiangyii]|uniref:Uncharacterized protein n=1 Tax=Cellulomonas shaoxiangyii TaxID=2566013 RepID=A0A4P7SG52_9CELL|nr:hypothetical protein [Cellulomonas shaoxiangyii]QCB92578.1 hypothetical protein E5225_02425 [Cellulomonas shaoxiangyii]TGY82815.1 hypothetical protein E5226_12765 [Cellulomonas shaoxiangyii]
MPLVVARAGRARRRPAPAAAVAAAVLAGTLTACGPPAPTPSTTTPAPTATDAGPLPDDVARALAVEVAQARTDRVARVVELRVRNAGPVDVTVVEGRLTTATTAAPAVTEKEREIRGGSTRAMRAALAAPTCPAVATGTAGPDPAPVVELDVVDAEGRAGTVRVVPTDETDDLRRVHGEDCAAAAVAAGLRLGLDDALVTREEDGRPVADLVLRVEPVAGGPHVRLVQVGGTTLLRPAAALGPWVVDVDSAHPPADGRVVLPVVPARCDVHAIAEDKRGTVLGVRAVVDGVEQPELYVAASAQLRGALHEFVRAACGVPDDART